MKRDTLSNRRGFTQQTTYEVAKQFHWLSVHRTLTVSLGRIQDLKNRPPENYCVPRRLFKNIDVAIYARNLLDEDARELSESARLT